MSQSLPSSDERKMEDLTDDDFDINSQTININGGNSWPYTMSTLNTASYSWQPSLGNITVSSTPSSGSWLTSNGSGSTVYTSSNLNGSNLKVSGDAEVDGDIKIKGKSLGEFMDTLERRLAILTPDPDKLAHFEALKKAYNHYKVLEALCELPNKKDE
jgi:hypothetical protein